MKRTGRHETCISIIRDCRFFVAAGCTEAGNYIGAVVALVLSGVLMHPEIQEVREQLKTPW